VHIGDWHIDSVAGRISRNGETVRLEARTLKLLLVLARRPGETVSVDELLDDVWSGVVVTPDSVYQAVATLRRLLGDDPKLPRYIATVPRLGYRLIAAVSHTSEDAAARPERAGVSEPQVPGVPDRRARSRRPAWTIGAVVAGITLTTALIFLRGELSAGPRGASQVSVGVAPFVDLTPSMDQDQLADDMTVGVADRLGRNPAFHTAGFRSSYALIGKHVSAEQAGRTLGVAYVVDGSVRRSGDIVRIVARLVRTDSGVVLWSQVSEQPLQKLDVAQEDVARDVSTTLMNIAGATR
jgi:DNA-binding winged helix-turn-helix (wHTH) protein/TolB-like protein